MAGDTNLWECCNPDTTTACLTQHEPVAPAAKMIHPLARYAVTVQAWSADEAAQVVRVRK
jgi:hypothetical protein